MASRASQDEDELLELIAEHTGRPPEEIRRESEEFYLQDLSEAEIVEEP